MFFNINKIYQLLQGTTKYAAYFFNLKLFPKRHSFTFSIRWVGEERGLGGFIPIQMSDQVIPR